MTNYNQILHDYTQILLLQIANKQNYNFKKKKSFAKQLSEPRRTADHAVRRGEQALRIKKILISTKTADFNYKH